MDTAPRITKEVLPQYHNRIVRIVGRVVNDNGQTAIINTSGEGSAQSQVAIHHQVDAHYTTDQFVEVIGKVNPDDTIIHQTMTSFGHDFDLSQYNKAAELSQKLPKLF